MPTIRELEALCRGQRPHYVAHNCRDENDIKLMAPLMADADQLLGSFRCATHPETQPVSHLTKPNRQFPENVAGGHYVAEGHYVHAAQGRNVAEGTKPVS